MFEPKIDPKTHIKIPMIFVRKGGKFSRAQVYGALVLLANDKGSLEQPASNIAEAARLHAVTVRAVLQQMVERDLIISFPRLSPENPTINNHYQLKPLPCDDVVVPVEVLALGLPSRCFNIYCYLLWFYQKYSRVPLLKEISYGVSLTVAAVLPWMEMITNRGLPLVTPDRVHIPYQKTTLAEEQEEAARIW